jgi:hypothetical protein
MCVLLPLNSNETRKQISIYSLYNTIIQARILPISSKIKRLRDF